MKSIIPVPYELEPDKILIPNVKEYIVDFYENLLKKFGDEIAVVIANGYIEEGYLANFLQGEQIVIGMDIAKLRKMDLLDDDESVISLMKTASKKGLGAALEMAGEDPLQNLFYLSAEVSEKDQNHVDIFMRRVQDEPSL